MRRLPVIILIINFLMMIPQIGDAVLIAQTDYEKHEMNDTTKQRKEVSSKDWQLKIGLSVNNTAINSECSYLISLSRLFDLSLDARPYSFISLTPAMTTKPIYIFDNVSISPKAGVGVILFGPVAGLEAFTAEFGLVLRYTVNSDYNILIEYKQISKSSVSEGFKTLPPKHLIKNFPIRLISIGIEF